MASTIQTIETPKRARALDTSGNNNHGQIYSGRALEFDGVTDYFQHNGGTNITGVNTFDDGSPWTFACWMYFNSSATTAQFFVGKDEDVKPHLMKPSDSSGVEIRFREDGSGDYYKFTTGGYPPYDTWHRVVVTTDGTTMTAYINGVLFGSFTKGDASTAGDGTVFSTTKMHFTGWGHPYETGGNRSYAFNGMMSDGQVWDAAWTADDASYDYLNPESLALNRGGTSLTESNLKMWYPMQDGHRGQQSYILDASNTGLGDEVVTNGDFSNGSTGWAITNSGAGATSEFGTGYVHLITDGTYTEIDSDGYTPLTASKSYLLQYDVLETDGGQLGLITYGNTTTQIPSTVGTHTWPFISHSTAVTIKRRSGALNIKLDNISVKPVNHKNNATTVFYGDEMITDTQDRDFSAALGSGDAECHWTAFDPDTSTSATVVTIDSARLKTVTTTEAADEREGCEIAMANLTAPVAGRTYRITCDMQATSAGFTLTAGFGGATTTQAITTSDTTYNIDIVATDAVGTLRFYTTENTARTWHMDNISVKEIGTASGWTDADQQLHIPQTALQSYNELAWFEGGSQRTTHDNGFTPGDNTTVAFWVFLNGPDGENKGLFNCISWNSDNFRIIVDPSNRIAVQIASSGVTTTYTDSKTTITKGKWIHVCATIPKATSSTGTIYINGDGENYTTSTTMATASRNINFLYGGGLTQEYVPGSITEVSIWNAILTQAEVKELYNDGKALDALIHSNTSNLTAYWRNNGLNTWTDLKGSDDGTITCDETMLIPQGLDGRDSQGFIMNKQRNTSSLNLPIGTDDYVHVPTRTDGGDDDLAFIGVGDGFSVSCWVKKNNVSSGEWVINRNDATDGWRLGFDGDEKLKFQIEENTNIVAAITDSALSLNTWYHVVGTFDGDPSNDGSGVVKLYLNSVNGGATTNDATSADMDASAANSIPLTIGSGHLGYFEGEIDGVLIYNKVLNQEEVERIYNATKASHRN